MNGLARRLRAAVTLGAPLAAWLGVLLAVLLAVCAWALWAVLQPDMVHQLALLMPPC